MVLKPDDKIVDQMFYWVNVILWYYALGSRSIPSGNNRNNLNKI